MPADTPRKPAPFPSREQIVEFIRASDKRVGKREIARAFHLNADQKVMLKSILKDLEINGTVARGRKRQYGEAKVLPSVAVIEISGTDEDGELLAKPVTWPDDVPMPTIHMASDRASKAAVAVGDRVLARLKRVGGNAYEGQVMRRLTAPAGRVLGIYDEIEERGRSEGRIRPIDRRAKNEFVVAAGDTLGAKPGELVWAEVRPGRPLGLRSARIVERLGDGTGPRYITSITLHDHEIPTRFSEAALRQAEAAGPAPLQGRDDLRSLPLVTIDGAEARDFDDAVWAEADPNPGNAGGWHVVVAIADVAWYVRPGDALDHDAYERGNSVYFPDQAVHMLPEALSSGWCSLLPSEDRPCMAAHLWLGADGTLIRHQFVRGMMRSAARLTYEQVQEARNGNPDDSTGPLMEAVIEPLYRAYQALACARDARGVLELDLPERRVVIGDDGAVVRVETRARYESHKLIEEFMICANVAAAETLEKRRVPCAYRVHDQPSREKLESLREFLETIGLKLPRGQVLRPKDFNGILARVADTPETSMVNEVVLRSQAQAVYDPENIGHFGLALRRYCHFTSPIRRYSDLLVHRALIEALGLGYGGSRIEPPVLADICEHISATERRAATAERDAIDRFTAGYLAEQVGSVFSGRVNGVTRFGLFVTLEDSGGDGLVPMRSLPDDYYVHDEKRHRLVGRHSGLEYRLGQIVDARLVEANPVTGGLILELAESGRAVRRARRGGGKGKGKGQTKRKPGRKPRKH